MNPRKLVLIASTIAVLMTAGVANAGTAACDKADELGGKNLYYNALCWWDRLSNYVN